MPHKAGTQVYGLYGEYLWVYQYVLWQGNIVAGEGPLSIRRKKAAAGLFKTSRGFFLFIYYLR